MSKKTQQKPQQNLVEQAVEKSNAGEIVLAFFYFEAAGMERQVGVKGKIPIDRPRSAYDMRQPEGILYWVKPRVVVPDVQAYCIAYVLGVHDLVQEKARYVDVPEMMQELTHPKVIYSYEDDMGKRYALVRANLKVKGRMGNKDMEVDLVTRVFGKEGVCDLHELIDTCIRWTSND